MYETEEEQVEALKRWWKENSTSTIIGVVMGVSIILGWNFWQEHKKERAAQASSTYEQLLKALDGNQNESADKIAERVQEQYKGTEYAAFSALFQAKLKAQQGDFAGAKQILKTLIADQNEDLANIARIRLARLMLATGEYEQGLQVVNEANAKASTSYAAEYDELVGDLYVALDRLDEARTSYQSAARNGQPSPLLQLKIDDLTAQEKSEAQK
ncbi:MAG: YfgM family protein [Methylobacter sp.]